MSSELVIELPSTLFATAESVVFQGAYALGSLDAGVDSYKADEPLAWQARVTNVGGAMLVEGSVTGSLSTQCVRCLDEMSIAIEGEVEGYFLIPGQGKAPEGMDEDEFDILPDNRRIDLKPLLDAAIMLELPLVALCREDCAGLCSVCGANLNEGPCGCASGPDEALVPENPFAVLKNLDLAVE